MKTLLPSFGRLFLLTSLAALSGQLVLACSSDSGGGGTHPDGTAGETANTTGGSNGDGGTGSESGGQNGSGGNDGSGGQTPVEPGDDVCSTDADCKGDLPVCDPIQGCVACLFDWDCPADHRCEDNECFAKQLCVTSKDCAKDGSREICDEVLGECVECREDATCGEGKRCERGVCAPFTACTNSRNCPEGLVCDMASGACVTCVVDGDCGDASSCVDNVCLPTCDSDKDCLAVSLLCDQSEGHCVECLSDADCPAIYYCDSGRCELDVCEQDQKRCENPSTLGTCSLSGRDFVNSTCSGNSTCLEDGTTAACVPWTCTPSQATCSDDGSSLVTCNADGTAVVSDVPCPDNHVCAGSACLPVVSEPGEKSCEDTQLRKCNVTGTGWQVLDTCLPYNGESCDPSLEQCAQQVCNPGYTYCDGNVLSTCNPHGTGPQAGGTDCSLTGQACFGSACKPIVCSGEYSCENGDLYSCYSNGTQRYLEANCGAAALCDAAIGTCKSPVCNPGAFVCNGKVATRCKADGSGYEANGQDCSQSGMVCDGGGCLPKTCESGKYFCQGGSPQQCSTSGATYKPTDSCTTSEFCQEGASYCQYDLCTAGAAVCSGNVATTCASDGSGPIAGGTNCAENGQVCEAGACKAVVCTPSETSCQGDALYTCNANGTTWILSQTCSAAQFCSTFSGTPACTADICTTGATGCNGEVVSTCASNGGSWINPGTDCAQAGDVCLPGGVCGDQEVTVQGATTTATQLANGGYLMTGFIALTPRKLTQLEVYGSVQGVAKITWVVYEKRATSSTYSLVYQKVAALASGAVGTIASGTLDFTFQKDKTYAVGVHVNGPGTFYYGSPIAVTAFATSNVAYLVSSSVTSPSSATSWSTTSSRPYLRMTTALPN